MYQSDSIRTTLLEAALNNQGLLTDRVTIKIGNNGGVYKEVIKEDEFLEIFTTKEEYKSLPPLEIAEKLVSNRISSLLEVKGYEISDDIDYTSSDFYDGYEITVPFKKINEAFNEDAFFEEMDNLFNKKSIVREKSVINGMEKPERVNNHRSSFNGVTKPEKNRASGLSLNKEPGHDDISNLPSKAKKHKTQNPRKVDLLLKSIFESKFKEYRLASDVGLWKPAKTLNVEGKLKITWENTEVSEIKIETLIFPKDSNKIKIMVLHQNGELLIDYFFEIYRIPTDAFLTEKFFRKTFFNLLKKFIETRVIQLEPFNLNFVFWKTDNPFFSYSFSSPKKNKIVKDLIAFISTARKPILDDFFEQNNLKHKQGYLQTLLDSAEAAGIFKFAREGNEIIILKGPNYKAFLEGKMRRVAS